MTFNSSPFVVFLVVALAAYWSTSIHGVRKAVLLVGSLIFYAFWDYRFIALVLYVTVVAYAGARALEAFPRSRRRILAVSVALELGQLVFFKYTNFLLGATSELATRIGLGLHVPRYDILLPIGVSFYTFHGVSYRVDVYRRKLPKSCDFVTVAIYIVFFPQLIAGPIVRANVFLPQLERAAVLSVRDVVVGLKFFTIGLVYKSMFADRLAPFVDKVYGAPSAFSDRSVLFATVGFYAQIYFDFAGYSLMAIGTSRLFGFKLPKNFDYPYRSVSVTEFWRRWHMSLSSWLRDYLYIPLGGNRHGELKQYRNLFLTMLLGGLWHGASFNFVLWGGLHGVALALHKLYETRVVARTALRVPYFIATPFSWLLTQTFVLIAWIPFRARGFSDTWTVLRAVSFQREDAGLTVLTIPAALLALPLVVDTLLVQNPRLGAFRWPRRPVVTAMLLGVALALTLPFLSLELEKFIYFQF